MHMAQLMSLPLTVSCCSKIQIGFTFLVPAHPGSHRQRAVKWGCVVLCFMPHRMHGIDSVLLLQMSCVLWSLGLLVMTVIIHANPSFCNCKMVDCPSYY